MSGALVMLAALLLDALIGWPQALFRRIGHPVSWFGALIDLLERHLNRPSLSARTRRLTGIATLAALLAAAILPCLLLLSALPESWRLPISALLAWPFLATRSLHAHVRDVAHPLSRGDLPAARAALAMIVGRDVSRLDAAGIARGGLESLAENSSDGIIAPLFWGVLFGLPGIVAYKAINTADSMIGHRTERFAAFGWASARLDDLVNLIPARLTGLGFALVSGRPGAGWRLMWRDAGLHRSPNAGWPEAAMAAALGVRLSGPRVYGDRVAEEPWVNDGARDPGAEELERGLGLLLRLVTAAAILLAILAAM